MVLATLLLTTGQLPPVPKSERGNDDAAVFVTGSTLWDSVSTLALTSGARSSSGKTTSDGSACTNVPCPAKDSSAGFAIFDEENIAVDPLYASAITSAVKTAARDFGVNIRMLRTAQFSMSLPQEGAATWSAEYERRVPLKEGVDDIFNASRVGDNATSNANLTARVPISAMLNLTATLWQACHDGALDGLVVALPLQTDVYPLKRQHAVYMQPEHYYVVVIRPCLENGVPVIALRGEFDKPQEGSTLTTENPYGVNLRIQHHIRPNFHSAGYQAGQEFVRNALYAANSQGSSIRQNFWCFFTTVSRDA